MIDPRRFKKSIKHAFLGVRLVFKSEQNFRIQVITAVTVLVLATLFHVTTFEYIILLLLIVSVLSLEMINSVFERIVDSFKPRIHPIVKEIKDIMAGTVLIASLVSALIGMTIFCPYIYALFERAS